MRNINTHSRNKLVKAIRNRLFRVQTNGVSLKQIIILYNNAGDLDFHLIVLKRIFLHVLPDTAHQFLATARRPHITVKSGLYEGRHDTAMTCN